MNRNFKKEQCPKWIPFSYANHSQIKQVYLATTSSAEARLTRRLWPPPSQARSSVHEVIKTVGHKTHFTSSGTYLTLLSYTRRRANKQTQTIWQSADEADIRERERERVRVTEEDWGKQTLKRDRSGQRYREKERWWCDSKRKGLCWGVALSTMLGYTARMWLENTQRQTDRHTVHDRWRGTHTKTKYR